MKKTLLTIAATVAITTSAQAEINPKSGLEQAVHDLACVSSLSIQRDFLFEYGQARSTQMEYLTELQDQYLIKYPIGHQTMNSRNIDRLKAEHFGNNVQLAQLWTEANCI